MSMRYHKIDDLPKQIALHPLPGVLLLPRLDVPLTICEPHYLAMVERAMAGNRIIGMIQPLPGDTSEKPKLEKIGCAGRITSYAESEDGRLLITITGICRFMLKRESRVEAPFRQGRVDFKPFAADLVMGTDAPSVNRAQVLEAFRQYLAANNLTTNWSEVNSIGTESLVNTFSLLAPYAPKEKQALLEAPDLKARADVLVALTELALQKSLGGSSTRMQ